VRESKLKGKSHDIPKQRVWAAWLKVKEKGGAAGADGVTIVERRLISARDGRSAPVTVGMTPSDGANEAR
jgi:hypothetical protein